MSFQQHDPTDPLSNQPTPSFPKTEFYKIKFRNLKFAEWYRLTGIISAIFAWVLARFGISLAPHQRVPKVNDHREYEIQGSQFPENVRNKIASTTMALLDAGFKSPVFLHIANRFSGYDEYIALFTAPNGDAIASVLYITPMPGYAIRQRLELNIISALEGGGYLISSDNTLGFDRPASMIYQYRKGATPAFIWRWHEETLRARGGKGPHLITRQEQMWEMYNNYSREDFSFHEARGLFIPTDPDEAAVDGELIAAEKTGMALNQEFVPAWVELQKIRIPRRKTGGALLLLITLLAFAATGFYEFSTQSTMIIIVVLIIHELGHYLAMRIFNYRDLRMFFIPFFGAAVSGRHHNVPGWKKAVVSLMGPIPGIFIGLVLSIWAIWSCNDIITEAAFMFLVLNGFNLLPVVPLDGGWFWNSILFSRRTWLEVLFKTLAGGAFILLCVGGFGKFFMYLGIFTLIGIPASVLAGNSATRLRKKGLSPDHSEEDSLNEERAAQIFTDINEATKSKLNPKTLATYSVQVHERINATPPNFFESVGLSAVYFVSFVIAILGTALMGLFMFDSEDSTEIDSSINPRTPPAVLDGRYNGEYKLSPATEPYGMPRHVIANFSSADIAGKEFDKLVSDKAPNVEIMHFGQSLMIASSYQKNSLSKIADSLQKSGSTVFDSGGEQPAFYCNLSGKAPDKSVSDEINRQLTLWIKTSPYMRPPPPWEADPALQESIERACATYIHIEKLKAESHNTQVIKRLSRRRTIALFIMQTELGKKWMQDLNEAEKRAERTALEALLKEQNPAYSQDLILHELKRLDIAQADYQKYATWSNEQRQLLSGQPISTQVQDTFTEEEEDSEEYFYGEVELNDTTVILKNMTIPSPIRSLPLMVKWLESKGCKDFHYGLGRHEPGYPETD